MITYHGCEVTRLARMKIKLSHHGFLLEEVGEVAHTMSDAMRWAASRAFSCSRRWSRGYLVICLFELPPNKNTRLPDVPISQSLAPFKMRDVQAGLAYTELTLINTPCRF